MVERLVRVRDDFQQLAGGRGMRGDSLHLTLVFVGEVDLKRLEELADRAARVCFAPFEFQLDKAMCWHHNRIGHLTCTRPPEPLLALVSQLERGLEGLDIPFDHRPYRPHVTLLRNADCKNGNPALEPIRWEARDFVLVRSTLRADGARYEELGRWPLLG